MIHHCQAVKRGAPSRPLLIGDMPFGSYEFKNVDIALQNAYRMVKEGGMDAVKFEVSCLFLVGTKHRMIRTAFSTFQLYCCDPDRVVQKLVPK